MKRWIVAVLLLLIVEWFSFLHGYDIRIPPSHDLVKIQNPSTKRWIQVTPYHHQNKSKNSVWHEYVFRKGGYMAFQHELIPIWSTTTSTTSNTTITKEEDWFPLQLFLEDEEEQEEEEKQRMQNDDDTIPSVKDLLVVYKPSGLLTLPGKTQPDCLSERVLKWLSSSSSPSSSTNVSSSTSTAHTISTTTRTKKRTKKKKSKYEKPWIPRPCHRLDLDTSGIVVIAKTKHAYQCMTKQFEQRLVEKQYIALVHGIVGTNNNNNSGTIDVPIGTISSPEGYNQWATATTTATESNGEVSNPRSAVTDWFVSHRFELDESNNNNYTRMVLVPHTGRGHQLRLHMKHLGHAILGDTLHGPPPTSTTTTTTVPRLCLHAEYISFRVKDDDNDRVCRASCWCVPPF